MADPQTTNYGEIQENEIQALQSIYADDFQEVAAKAGAWNKKADRSFTLRLKPNSYNDGDHATVLLGISLPTTYPKTLPNCQVTFDEHLSKKARQAINILLQTKPKELVGTEMIFTLASDISEVLEEAAIFALKTQDLPALDEERIKHEAAIREKANEERKIQEHKQQQAEDEENRILTEMVKQEKSRMASKLQIRSKSYRSEGLSSSMSDPLEGDVTFDQEIKVQESGNNTVVAFRSIINKSLHRSGPVTKVFGAVPALFEIPSKDVTPYLALKCCTLRAEKQHIQSLESKLEGLVGLPGHAGVMNPLAFRIIKSIEGPADWNINVLCPLAQRGSLGDLLDTVGKLDIKNLRSWTIQLLEGLDFLHRHRVVHARVSPDNVLLERTEAGTTVVKLCDASFQHDLHSFSKNNSSRFSSATSAYWVAPESASRNQCIPSPPKDIWDLGVLILQMAFGAEVQRQHNSPSSLIEAFNLSQSFEELLARIFKEDAKKRPTAFELLPSEFLRDDDPVLEEFASNAVSRVHSGSLSTTQTPMRYTRARLDSSHAPPTVSRYANDFVEAGKLGKGAFGEVVRARNKLDGTIYAIKKITQNSTSALSPVLSEVILLSKLNNPYIVRYYTAWIEEEGLAQSIEVDDSTSEDLTESQILTSGKGLDFISSSKGFPDIEFGYDTDEEPDSEAVEDTDEFSTEEELLQPSVPRTQRRRSSTSASAKVTLYIQMELCDKHTLRHLMKDLVSDIPECWRLFRQVLEGLAHVHGHGVIHRDLKPENIFITGDDGNGARVRIGDFGLAKPGEASGKAAHAGFSDARFTADVGTAFYVAPEVKSTGGGSYNSKADMFSLGVILLEMSYTLSTGMERHDVLQSIQTGKFELPSYFQESERQVQGEIISSLIKHKASDRPFSNELLRSGKVPSQIEDGAMRNALSSLTDKSSPFYMNLMEGLFAQNAEGHSARDYMYDHGLGLTSYTKDDLLLQSLIKDTLTSVFRRHGGVESRRQIFVPGSNHYDSAVKLLDGSGDIVQLNYDLTLPFARTLAKQPDLTGKFYTFGNVYRMAPAGLHPRAHGEVDFDIVTDNALDLALREAEVIKVVDEIGDAIPSLANATLVYHITHSKLIEAILSFCEIPNDNATKQIISRLNIGQFTWSKIRTELSSIGAASTSLDELMRFNFRASHKEAIPKLRSLLQDTEEIESTFRHLEAVCTYLERFKVKRKVYISPLSSYNERFYRGNMLFQCVQEEKRKRVICAGGRYDRLIQELRTDRGNTHAVGFNLAWENLFETMVKFQKRSPQKAFLKKAEDTSNEADWKQKRCDVLIDSIDESILRSRGIKLVQELWSHGISAELVIDSDVRESTSYQHQSRDDRHDHDWVVLIKQDEPLKVRSAISKEDVEIRSSELVGWLRGELRERDRLEAVSHSVGKSQHGVNGTSSTEREAEVSVLVAQHKSKKTKRQGIVEDAHERTAELASNLLSAPIITVEMKDDLFEGLRDTRLSDTESWRRYIQGAPLTDRSYLSDLHRLLLEKAEEQKNDRQSFIYNFRTRGCFYYDLSTAKNG